ncbi:hypothetical protein ACFWPQ_40875 [Streptomyces sp. NPDC058464]|uniref:hypothetical protein n=1 Tax=Streptomyces sp. NPDC058464 TaxID=3346511 RepID=UPI003652C628
MSPELTPDQVMRVVAALQAAWSDDNDALAALVRGGHDEQPLAALIAEFGVSRMQTMVLIATGISDQDGADRQEALTESEGLILHMTTVAVSMVSGWALSASGDVQATGDLARHVLQAILSFTSDGDNPQEVQALFAHLRADALAHS